MLLNKWFVALMLTLSACSPGKKQAQEPKQVLNEYISMSFAVSAPQDRAKMLKLLTGETKSRMQSWSDEQFLQAFVESKRKFVKLVFREVRNVSDREVLITYDLVYDTHSARMTNQKLAQLLKQSDEWLIGDVKNLKEVVEYRDALSLP
jgi:hypothetical protein